MRTVFPMKPSPNHALQRTAPVFTPRASFTAFPSALHRLRRPRKSAFPLCLHQL
jgi:hypothetical protein